jgi:hypothetical protein
LARIRAAKNATSNAFIAAKKKKEEYSLLGVQKPSSETRLDNVFEEQHHHLLSCLEHATDREFVEIDTNILNFNNQLLQLKLQQPERIIDSKMINNLLNCFACHRRNKLGNDSNDVNSNNKEEKNQDELLDKVC